MRSAEVYKFTETDQKGYFDALIAIEGSLFKSIIPKTASEWVDVLYISYEEFEQNVRYNPIHH